MDDSTRLRSLQSRNGRTRRNITLSGISRTPSPQDVAMDETETTESTSRTSPRIPRASNRLLPEGVREFINDEWKWERRNQYILTWDNWRTIVAKLSTRYYRLGRLSTDHFFQLAYTLQVFEELVRTEERVRRNPLIENDTERSSTENEDFD